MMKLHLGCGKRYLKGFVHVDLADFEHIDFKKDIRDLSFLEDKSATEIYVSHAFEYFDRVEAQDVLRSWFNTLSPGGNLYIVVPDFDALLRIYSLSSNDLDSILGPLFGRWRIGDEIVHHKTTYNLKGLMEVLSMAGFGAIEQFDPVVFLGGIDPTYDDHSLAFWPHFDRTGVQVSLCLKANRPT